MKKLIIVIFMIFALCSCKAAENIPKEPALEDEPSASEEVLEETPEKPEEDKISDPRLIEYASGGFMLSEQGISQKAYDMVIHDNGTMTFDLVLEKDGKEIKKNIRGLYLKSDRYGTNIDWGGYSFCGDYLSVCYIGGFFIIDLKDFSVLDIDFEIPETENTFWINGVIYDEKTGWIVSAAEAKLGQLHDEPMPWRIFIFDKNGKLLEDCVPAAFAPYGGWADFSTPAVMRKCTTLENDGKTYYSFDYRCYCPDDGKSYQGSPTSQPYDAVTDGYRIYFYSAYQIDNAEDVWLSSSGTSLGYYAVLKDENENILDFISTENEHIPDSDNWGEVEEPLKVTNHGEGKFTVENIYLAKSMELDFEKETYSLSYNYTDEHLCELIADSKDGNYSLWQAGADGGGEAYFYEVALRNNRTGKIYHVESNGTNSGAFSGEGFLKNGDFYVMSSSGLCIYDPKNVELLFDLNKNFSMEERILYTFRRDPNDFSYIVVYSDCTDEDIQKGYASEEFLMPFTIKIGYLDKDGKLIKSFDSGIFEQADFFGLEAIEMRYSEDIITIVTLGGKGLSGREFTFDRRTETFSKP